MIDDQRVGLDIGLISRWQNANEIDRMQQVVELLFSAVRRRIAAIWCDSGAYRLLVSVDDRQTALLIAELFEEAIQRVVPGGVITEFGWTAQRETSSSSWILGEGAMSRDYATDAALRPQPKRDGPDHWSTPDCLSAALVTHILPSLPRAPIWEPAAGDGALVSAIEATGHRVFASDIVDSQDFLISSPPHLCQSLVTNPPFNQLSRFLQRAVSLVDSPDNNLIAAVLLLRWDALTARGRALVLQQARQIHLCTWRPRWIADSTTSPRWSFCWVTWRRGCCGPPTMHFVQRDEPKIAPEPVSKHAART
jgi:hypothetical protein